MWLQNLKKNPPYYYVAAVPAKLSQKESPPKLCAKIRETCTRFLQNTHAASRISIHDKLGWVFWFLKVDNSYVSLHRWTAKMQTGDNSYVSLHRLTNKLPLEIIIYTATIPIIILAVAFITVIVE